MKDRWKLKPIVNRDDVFSQPQSSDDYDLESSFINDDIQYQTQIGKDGLRAEKPLKRRKRILVAPESSSSSSEGNTSKNDVPGVPSVTGSKKKRMTSLDSSCDDFEDMRLAKQADRSKVAKKHQQSSDGVIPSVKVHADVSKALPEEKPTGFPKKVSRLSLGKKPKKKFVFDVKKALAAQKTDVEEMIAERRKKKSILSLVGHLDRNDAVSVSFGAPSEQGDTISLDDDSFDTIMKSAKDRKEVQVVDLASGEDVDFPSESSAAQNLKTSVDKRYVPYGWF